jgi:hypothetical protein
MLLYLDLDGSSESVPQSGPSLVLATQDCDLVKPSVKIPFVEALVCQEMGEKDVQEILPNDARFFVLDRADRLVADRNHVVLFRKKALLALGGTPSPPCGGADDRRRRFSRWLGARYDRPALPDEFGPHLINPLSDAYKKLASAGKRYGWLANDLREIRVLQHGDGPPFSVSLIFLLRKDADADAANAAVAEIIERARLVVLDTASEKERAAATIRVSRIAVVPEDRLQLLVYWESRPLALERFTYKGDEVVGPEPLNAEPTT